MSEPTFGAWIPVGERLPKTAWEVDVLWTDGHTVKPAVYSWDDGNSEFREAGGNGTLLRWPTHWMPMPKPPLDESPSDPGDNFAEHLERASEIVRSMPAWKRHVFRALLDHGS